MKVYEDLLLYHETYAVYKTHESKSL